MKLKNKHKAFLTILGADAVSNIIFAYLIDGPITQKIVVTSVIFSMVSYFVLKNMGVLNE